MGQEIRQKAALTQQSELAHDDAAWRAHGRYRDPFDRMLAAQAEIELAALVSSDEAMVEFGIPLLW